jgi:cytochrome P450
LSSGLLLLLKHPDQFEALRNEFSLIPQMIEEVLRYESPAQWLPRMMEGPGGVTVAGTHIPEGARVALVWASANRDKEAFKRADQFDIFREDVKQHLAFGFGTHFCVGAALARVEGRIVFEQLLSRLTGIECLIPLDQVRYRTAPIDRTLESLPIRFRAA